MSIYLNHSINILNKFSFITNLSTYVLLTLKTIINKMFNCCIHLLFDHRLDIRDILQKTKLTKHTTDCHSLCRNK